MRFGRKPTSVRRLTSAGYSALIDANREQDLRMLARLPPLTDSWICIEGLNVSMLESESAVRRIIAKFATSFDLQAWDELAECLAESIYTDFSELRGIPPEAVARHDFVAARRAALEKLRTHHLTGNAEVYINGTSATARVSTLVYRRNEAGQIFNSHCLYLLGFQSRNEQWAICSIVQRVLWDEGDPNILFGPK